MSLHWDDLRYFLALHRLTTLKAAGAELKTDPTTVGRRLTALETELGTRLFDRTPEGFVPTDAGLRLLPIAEGVAEQMASLERSVAGEDDKLEGIVRITATEMLATRFVVPHLPRFALRHPHIELVLDCSNQVVSLARREADIALRLARPHEESLVAQRLASIDLGLFAAPSYIEEHGMPARHTQSLRGHRLLKFVDTPAFTRENRWFDARFSDATVALRASSVSAVYAGAVAGLGIALLPCAVAHEDPRLMRVPSDDGPEPRSIWQVVHRDLQHTARIRAVLDFLARVLRSRPARHSV